GCSLHAARNTNGKPPSPCPTGLRFRGRALSAPVAPRSGDPRPERYPSDPLQASRAPPGRLAALRGDRRHACRAARDRISLPFSQPLVPPFDEITLADWLGFRFPPWPTRNRRVS